MEIIGEDRSPPARRRLAPLAIYARAGFTLVEIVVALAVLGSMAAGCFIGLNTLNGYAVSSRLYTEAQAAAQNQIDLILSKGPFNIAQNKIPAELALGTVTKPNVFIYTDPVSGNVVVSGTMTTTITDTNSTMTFAGITSNLNVRKANVTVAYSFRGKNYSVSMDTLRTADQ
jgi:prepilin-type N-terminal cleavage/methylation domain-containing protein